MPDKLEKSNTKRCAIIFGGSGFIGTHLAEELEYKNFEVIVADLVPPERKDLKFITCDVRENISLEIASKPEIVFNLAAIHRTPGHKPSEYYETNVKGAKNVTRWAADNSINRIVFTSSISVYGPNKNLLDENTAPAPISDYGKSKLMAEEIHSQWQNEDPQNRTLVICRPAVVFGRNERGNFTRLAKALKRRYFFFPGGRETRKASGYVKDATRSLIFFAEKDISQIVYNFSFPRNYTIGEICDAFCNISNYAKPMSIPVAQVGKALSKVGGPLGNLGQRLLKLVFPTNIAPTKLQEFGFTWKYDLQSALNDWNIESKFDQN